MNDKNPMLMPSATNRRARKAFRAGCMSLCIILIIIA